jgi:hypothetical protein
MNKDRTTITKKTLARLGCLYDEADLPMLTPYAWKRNVRYGYIFAILPDGKTIYMHRLLMNAQKGEMVDHRNGIRHDNRRSNLRLCSRSQNGSHRVTLSRNNTSGVTGVHYSSARDRWVATWYVDTKQRTRICTTKEDAISARRAAEVLYYGEFAPSIREAS